MKKILGEYAYPLIISAGFCVLILISWMFNQISGNNTQIFWMSVLPSAFVDVISLVISTILITKLIEEKKVYREKTQLYGVIKTAHINLISNMLNEYRIIIQYKHANYYYDLPDESALKFDDIAPFFKENLYPKFQQDILVLNKIYNEEVLSGSVEVIEETDVQRLELMNNYQLQVDRKITNFLREYSTVLTTEYMRLLIEIKEIVKSNPLEVHAPFREKIPVPVILDIEQYILKNQKFINSILELEKYFSEVSLEGTSNKKWKLEWGYIGIGAAMIFIVYLLILIGEFLVSL